MDILSARVIGCIASLKLDGGDVETLKTVLLVGVDVTGGEKVPNCGGRNVGGVVIPDGNGLARPVDGGGLSASALFSGDEEVEPFIE